MLKFCLLVLSEITIQIMYLICQKILQTDLTIHPDILLSFNESEIQKRYFSPFLLENLSRTTAFLRFLQTFSFWFRKYFQLLISTLFSQAKPSLESCFRTQQHWIRFVNCQVTASRDILHPLQTSLDNQEGKISHIVLWSISISTNSSVSLFDCIYNI